jgi:hypothetical protein
LIKDLDRVLHRLNHHEHVPLLVLFSWFRQGRFTSQPHEPHCRHHGPQKIRLPDEDHTTLAYKDFESILVKYEATPLDAHASGSKKIQNHQPSGFCFTIVPTVEDFCQPPVVYRGVDAVDKFLDCLLEEERQIY